MNSDIEKSFWRFWLSGLALLVFMICMNPWLSTDVAPLAILDHQAAGTAERVDAIQMSWKNAGVLSLARISVAIDLLFIAIYARGAYLGGRIARLEVFPLLNRLGTIIIIAALAFFLLDYTETISQFIQIMTFTGDDILANIAATVRPAKSIAFLTTFIALIMMLIIRAINRSRA